MIIRRYMRLWWAFVRNCFSRQMEFRADLITTFFSEVVYQGFHLAFFAVVTSYTDIADWTRYETFALLGTVYIIDAFMMVFIFSNLINLPTQINKGEIDHALLKPVNAQFFLSFRYARPQNILPFFTGLGLLIWGLSGVAGEVSLLSLVGYCALCFNALIILYATFFAFQTMAFWLVSSQGFEGGYFMLYNFILRPDSIFSGTIKVVLTFFIPAIVIGSVPARMILPTKAAAPELIVWSFFCAALTLALSVWFFRKGLRRYESASS